MRIFYFLAAILLSAAVFILLGLTPERISGDIMSFMHRDRSLKYKVDVDFRDMRAFLRRHIFLSSRPA